MKILLREQVMELNRKIAEAGDLRNEWDSDDVESGKQIVKRLRAELKGIPHKTKPAVVGSDQKKLEDEIKTHTNDRAVIMASLKSMRSTRKDKKDKLDGFALQRKSDDKSLLSGIDAILQRYGIKRQAYHGGDLVGGHIGILMERAEDIIDDVESYLIDSKKNLVNDTTNQVPASDEDIRTTCESIKHLLVLWDMIFSLVHTEYPSVEDCDMTQEFIDTAISIGDRLGMSRTIKIHGCMSHIVSQMRRIPCGLSDFDENFMEQYHQKGAANDVRLKHVKNVEMKGNIVSARLRRSEHPGTKAAIQRMVDDHSKGKRKKTLESEKANQSRKKEKRNTYELPERPVNESDAAAGTSGDFDGEEGAA